MISCNKKHLLFYGILAIFCLFLMCIPINYDYDLFAKLILGERLVEYGIFPFNDFYSYTPTHTWYDHEWGSGVIFYLLLKYIGPFGFILFQAAVMFLISVFIIKTQRLQKHAFPPSLLFIVVTLSLFLLANNSLIRCHIITFLFFSIFLYILEATRWGKARGKFKENLIWILPVITLFWNNIHGGVVSGVGLIAMYFAGAVLEKRPWKKYLAVFILSGLTLLVSPYGIEYFIYLLSATTMQRKYITEWWPFYNKAFILYYLPISLSLILSNMIFGISQFKSEKYDFTKLIVLSVTLYLGLAHVKLLPLSLIATAAFCYNDIAKIFLRIKKTILKIEKMLPVSIITIALLLIPMSSPLYPRASYNKFPLYEIEFLKINNIKGNIVTPFGLGSYSAYKLYPDNLIFMDGRYEAVYYDKEFLTLRDFELVENNWDDIFKNYPTDILMPKLTTDVYAYLKKQPEWTLIFVGRECGVFVKTKDVKDHYDEPEYNLDYYRKTMFKHGDLKND